MRRGRKAASYPLVAVLLLVLVLASRCGAQPPSEPTSASRDATSTAPSTSAEPSVPVPQPEVEPGDADQPESAPSSAPRTRKAQVTKVVDGDTAWVMLDGRREKVRFIGVDTPESTTEHEPYGKEASTYTSRAIGGREVWLETDVGLRDRYGRLLAYVWLERPNSDSPAEIRDKMLNACLLADGQAQMMTVPPNVRYVELFGRLQREARENSRGLWALEQ